MQTAFAVDLARRESPPGPEPSLSVAVSGDPAACEKIRALVRDSGARIVAESERYDVLLFAADDSTPPEFLKHLSRSAPACAIWLTGKPSRTAVLQLLRSGIAGVLSLDCTPDQLKTALEAIGQGLQVLQASLTESQVGSASEPVTVQSEELTDREQQVLVMMADGLSNKEISSRLAISTHTVKFHISSILGKLGAGSRTEAVSIGIRSGRIAI